jgi:hypothetical protein
VRGFSGPHLPDGDAFRAFVLNVVELGSLNLDEHASSPRPRLSIIHLFFLLRADGTTIV